MPKPWEKYAAGEGPWTKFGQADQYVSRPNPTGQPLGADIPNNWWGNVKVTDFLKEVPGAARHRAGQAADVALEVGPAMVGGALGLLGGPAAPLTVPLGAIGGELAKQGVRRYIGGEQPSTEDDIVSAMNVGVGAVTPFAVKGVRRVSSLLEQRAARKAAQGNLDKQLLAVQEAGREKKLILDIQARQQKAAQDEIKRQALLMEKRATHEELIATRQSAEEAKAAIQQDMAVTARLEGPKFGPKTDFGTSTGSLIAKKKEAIGGRVSELYTKFESFPEAQQPFESIDLKQIAAEISANTTPIAMPSVVAKTMALPDEVPLYVAESVLSDLKSAARHSGLFANKSQYVSGRVADKLDNQIAELLGSTEGGVMALNYLKAGRALHRMKIMTFVGGDKYKIPTKIQESLALAKDPIFIAANPVKLKSFIRQTGPEGLPILKRELWDTTVEKAVNPQTGEFSIDAFAKRFNKFRHMFSEEEKIIGDQLARGDHGVLANMERATRDNMYEIRITSQELKNAVATDQVLKKNVLINTKQRTKLTVDQESRAKRLEMSLEEGKGFSAPIKALIFGAQMAIGGASIVAARRAALRALFNSLSIKK